MFHKNNDDYAIFTWGFAWFIYIYNFFLKDKALLYSPNWPGTGTA